MSQDFFTELRTTYSIDLSEQQQKALLHIEFSPSRLAGHMPTI